MRPLDYYLQRLRIDAALRWIRPGSRVLDVGCADGALFSRAGARIRSGVGIDIDGTRAWSHGEFARRVGRFPDAVAETERFDAVVMLAVVEHVSSGELDDWAAAMPAVLDAGGRLIVTAPSPLVDPILHVGRRLRLLDGMEAEQHHGFDPRRLADVFTVPGIELEHRQRFELGMNHLCVFRATA
jgi:SAM-dependent methyltransferase